MKYPIKIRFGRLKCRSESYNLCKFVRIHADPGLRVYECDRLDCDITKIITTRKINFRTSEQRKEEFGNDEK